MTKEKPSEENSRTHHPEFIEIDDRADHWQRRRAVLFEAQKRIPPFPFWLRLLCFFGSFLALFWALLCLISWSMTTIFCAFTLFRLRYFVVGADRLLQGFLGGLVLANGFFVATFSPYLGMVIIMAYFMLNNEDVLKGKYSSIIPESLRRFMEE